MERGRVQAWSNKMCVSRNEWEIMERVLDQTSQGCCPGSYLLGLVPGCLNLCPLLGWFCEASLFFLKSLVRAHGAPLFPIPFNFSRPRVSQKISFFPSFFLPSPLPPSPLLPSFLSFCFYYLFSRLWNRRGVSETTFTEDLLFARNLTYIMSLNLWNNAKQWDWLFSYFPPIFIIYFKGGINWTSEMWNTSAKITWLILVNLRLPKSKILWSSLCRASPPLEG